MRATLEAVLREKKSAPTQERVKVFAPANIALCKYWGKRDTNLNLPCQSSLSVGLGALGAQIELSVSEEKDRVIVNQKELANDFGLGLKINAYLECYRAFVAPCYFTVDITLNIPFAAGFSSSSCIFAAFVKSLNEIHGWDLPQKDLSVMARLGSGSATRSLWDGFVIWQRGNDANGLDSHGVPITTSWPGLYLGLCVVSRATKPVDSREGMNRTTQTSPLYSAWVTQAEKDFVAIQAAIEAQDFAQLGPLIEANALGMHATMLTAWPPLLYSTSESVAQMHKVWQLREEGLPVYFTQDAGPNLKLLFQEEHKQSVLAAFPEMQTVQLF